MDIAFWSLVGFLSGSIPYSVIIGKLAGKIDIRQVGDKNPGTANVLRSAGWGWGALAMLFDYLKGAVPVGFAWFVLEFRGWGIVLVALAPLLGHAFSPWLKFRGGKAVATTFGIWSGLTIGAGPTILGLLLGVYFAVIQISGWAVLFCMLSFGGFVWRYYGGDLPEFLWIWLGNFLLLVYKHRMELRQPLRMRPAFLRWVRRGE
ncbi:MAG: glycerol-3-phosphate acyltransferase [Anaerolineales bacterium]|nr:glycerol-3-phosphate acyltransferase [Anaerolineales bacterium]